MYGLEIARTCAREEMASFPNLRTPVEPSDESEGVRMSGVLPLAVAALVLAAGTVVALSELATLRGSHTVHTAPEFLTSALGAPRSTASLVRTPAPLDRSRA